METVVNNKLAPQSLFIARATRDTKREYSHKWGQLQLAVIKIV